MASTGWKFGWKRKIGSNISVSLSTAFEDEAKDDHEDNFNNPDIDWLCATKSRKVVCLEDPVAKSKRLKEEGTVLAESERYWEAIKKWDEALHYTPDNAKIYEMKAQALMILCEVFPAVKTAQHVVKLDPTWWIGYQTLGRAQLNLGEVKQAVQSFSKAVHLNPDDEELWKEDLLWAYSLLQRKTVTEESDRKAHEVKHRIKIKEIDSKDVSESEILDIEQCFDSDTDQQTHDTETTTVRTLPDNYVLMRD